MKETALVICPGRGSYSAETLGYFSRHHQSRAKLASAVEQVRACKGQISIFELDRASSYQNTVHGNGKNISALIYACALGDFLAIDRGRFDIVGVVGNSMGWYLALTCAGALDLRDGALLVNEMGALMDERGVGGQIIYPIVDENWRPDPSKLALIEDLLSVSTSDRFIAMSIKLGGYVVFAANHAGLAYLMENLPAEDGYPVRLRGHAAFHSTLLNDLIEGARRRLPQSLFRPPTVPLIDGIGRFYMPGASDVDDLYAYTLGDQINQTYDFSKTIEVAVKELAPDRIIILGPGNTLSAPVAQELIRINWRDLDCKAAFKERQTEDPFILSMGVSAQRRRVANSATA